MKERGSPGTHLFVGIGFWIVAWRFMPAPDWHLTGKIFVGFLAIVGMVPVLSAITQSARRVGPWWQGLAGRLLAVAIAWLMIIGAAWHYGTPHVLYEYPLQQSKGRCVYFGWSGFVQRNGPCANVIFLRAPTQMIMLPQKLRRPSHL